METQVVLVNEKDEAVGIMEKMEVHRRGALHRAFSVFIFDSEGKLLLQQRAPGKYHGGGLWTNTCCSHPLPGEAVERAAARRLGEEMGFETPLQKIFDFIYASPVENNLIEHEFDHVFAGSYEGKVIPDPDEVAAYEYRTMAAIRNDVAAHPHHYTVWFRMVLPRVEAWWQKEFQKHES